MGRVHQQTVNEGRGCEEFYHICLSEINVIKSLILNRSEFDQCFESKTFYNKHPFVTNGIPLFQEPVEVLYLDLEKLIEEALNKYEKFIVLLLMRGYDYDFISEKMKWTQENVENMFKMACKKIKEQNDYNWKTWTETSGLVKIPSEVKYKRCKKCNKDLRIENFSPKSDAKDGLHPYCKKCR